MKLKEYTSNLIKEVLEDEEGFISNRRSKKTTESENSTDEDEEKVEAKFALLDENVSDIEHIKIWVYLYFYKPKHQE